MADGPILGIVLAAGMSRRLGRPKQLLLLDKLPLVAYVVRLANQSDLDGAIVVGGHAAEDVSRALAGIHHDWVFNPDFATGQASSLAAGVRAADAMGADAVVVLLSDQPGVPLAAINGLVAARRERSASIAMTTYGEDRSHPVLFGREHFPALKAISGDQGGRDVIRHNQSSVVLVPSGLDVVPLDVDTDEDYDALLSRTS